MNRRIVATLPVAATAAALATPAVALATGPAKSSTSGGLPVSQIEDIMQAEGTVSDSVLQISEDRSDLHVRGGNPTVGFLTGFQIQNDITFQSIGGGRAIVNGDLALKLTEIQSVIDGFLSHGIIFQAQHQHLYDLSPMVWFVHFRETGTPAAIARDVHAVIATDTATPLPQKPPAHPSTPLPAKRLGQILGGSVEVGEHGVVTVDVPRRHGVVLGGVRISPELNIQNSIQFEPLGGNRAAAVPDFSMTASEIQAVMKTMRGFGWQVGCLYNQETAEQPQLYFSHQFKTGDAVILARQIRQGLNHTDAES